VIVTDVWRGIEEHLGSEQVSRVIYGAIIGMALVVVLEHQHPTAGVVAATLVATGLAVGLAEVYSDFIGTQTRLRGKLERHHYRHMLKDVVAVFFGIVFPDVFFVIAALGAMETDTAFALAKWSGLALIACYGFAAGRLSGSGFVPSLLHGLAVAAIGAALIAFKAILH
jgi:hypothetical protein